MLRRSVVLGGSSLLLMGLSTACQPGSTPPTETTGAWQHTLTGYDGKQISLSRKPEIVVADGYSMAAMWPYGFRPQGVWGYGLDDPAGMGEADPNSAEIIGRNAEFSLEKLASLKPDAIIGFGNRAGTGWTWWDEGVLTQATQVATFIPIQTSQGVRETIEEYRSLAESLGLAGAAGERLQADRTAFDTELNRIKQLAATKKLRVLPLSFTVDTIYAAGTLGVVKLLNDQGVNVVKVKTAKENAPWAELSWETIGEYPADLYLTLFAEGQEPKALPSYQRLPPVQAKQTLDWNDKRPYNYGNYAAWLKSFADAYEAAQPLG